VRPRATLGAALTLGGFLLVAPIPFVLLPLGLLLLLSRLDRAIHWIVVGGALLLSVGWIVAPGPLAVQVVKGWLVVATGTFVAWALPGRRPAIDAAVLATLTASGVTLAWLAARGVLLETVLTDALRGTWEIYRAMGDAAPGLRVRLQEAGSAAASVRELFPALTILGGIAGLLLAWRWYHLLIAAPAGLPPTRFRDFRFSDHFVWLMVMGMAGTVAQFAELLDPRLSWPGVLVVIAVGLYVVRGAAVATTLAFRATSFPAPVLLLAGLGVLFLAPFVAAGLLGVGLADTWLDFRRRAADASGE
jgi:hypothetical protein